MSKHIPMKNPHYLGVHLFNSSEVVKESSTAWGIAIFMLLAVVSILATYLL